MNIQQSIQFIRKEGLKGVSAEFIRFINKVRTRDAEAVYLAVNIIKSIGGAFTGTAYGLTLFGGGLNLFTMMLPNVIFFSMNSLLEIPTGIFADRVSLKGAVRIGLIFWALGMFFYGIASHIPGISPFIGFLIGEGTAAVGSSFISGAFFALVKKTSNANEEGIRNIEAKARAYGGYAGLAASFFSGFAILIFGLSGIWFVAATLTLVSLAVFEAYMPDAVRNGIKHKHEISAWRTFKIATQYYRENKNSRYILFGNAILEFTFQPLNMYWSLLFRGLFGEALTGMIWSAANFFYSYGSDSTRNKSKDVGAKYMISAALKISVVVISGVLAGNILAGITIALAFISHEYWRGQLRPIMNARIVSTSDPLIHATVMSAGETVMHASRISGLLLFGFFALHFGILATWLLSGFIMLISVIFFRLAGE